MLLPVSASATTILTTYDLASDCYSHALCLKEAIQAKVGTAFGSLAAAVLQALSRTCDGISAAIEGMSISKTCSGGGRAARARNLQIRFRIKAGASKLLSRAELGRFLAFGQVICFSIHCS